jgi:hypothetical protein
MDPTTKNTLNWFSTAQSAFRGMCRTNVIIDMCFISVNMSGRQRRGLHPLVHNCQRLCVNESYNLDSKGSMKKTQTLTHLLDLHCNHNMRYISLADGSMESLCDPCIS